MKTPVFKQIKRAAGKHHPQPERLWPDAFHRAVVVRNVTACHQAYDRCLYPEDYEEKHED